MKKHIYILALLLITLSACKKDEVVGGTAVQDVSGEWWLQVQVVDQEGEIIEDYSDEAYTGWSTYNTADNSNTQMWFDDGGNYWVVKGKVNINLANKTFSGENIQNESYDSKFTITNGKILVGAAIGPVSKAVTDSISYTATFDDDDNNFIYHFKGYRRTKFSGDDH
ncbi:lipid-binding protein [Pedobacter sp. B4-66]|uniref:lipid-binding protein n=1 Tax=Pedobacter sp. B4-66 TaxID=2817280 RepID=UPI001BDA711B|nr:lipid-binding protein [Pedobacter sp. B4-66]